MTISEKQYVLDQLGEKLSTHMLEAWNDDLKTIERYPVWKTQDVIDLITNIAEEPTKCSLNYEAEYHRLLEENMRLAEENSNLKREADRLDKRYILNNTKLQTIISTLEVVYGRSFDF